MSQKTNSHNCKVSTPGNSVQGRAKPFTVGKVKAIYSRGKIKDHYYDWDGFSTAIKKLGIRSYEEYQQRFREDELLMEDPEKYIRGFPGWDKVFENILNIAQSN